MFGGLMSGLGSLASGAIGSGMFKGGGTDASSILTNPNIPDMGYKTKSWDYRLWKIPIGLY